MYTRQTRWVDDEDDEGYEAKTMKAMREAREARKARKAPTAPAAQSKSGMKGVPEKLDRMTELLPGAMKGIETLGKSAARPEPAPMTLKSSPRAVTSPRAVASPLNNLREGAGQFAQSATQLGLISSTEWMYADAGNRFFGTAAAKKNPWRYGSLSTLSNAKGGRPIHIKFNNGETQNFDNKEAALKFLRDEKNLSLGGGGRRRKRKSHRRKSHKRKSHKRKSHGRKRTRRRR